MQHINDFFYGINTYHNADGVFQNADGNSFIVINGVPTAYGTFESGFPANRMTTWKIKKPFQLIVEQAAGKKPFMATVNAGETVRSNPSGTDFYYQALDKVVKFHIWGVNRQLLLVQID
jgi:hypothetical protein